MRSVRWNETENRSQMRTRSRSIDTGSIAALSIARAPCGSRAGRWRGVTVDADTRTPRRHRARLQNQVFRTEQLADRCPFLFPQRIEGFQGAEREVGTLLDLGDRHLVGLELA